MINKKYTQTTGTSQATCDESVNNEKLLVEAVGCESSTSSQQADTFPKEEKSNPEKDQQKCSKDNGRHVAPIFVVFNPKNHMVRVSPTLLARYIRSHLSYRIVRNQKGQKGFMIYVYNNGKYELCDETDFLGKIKAPIVAYDEDLVRMSTLRETYELLMTDATEYTQEDVNADENVINFKNGLLYISADKLELRPHSPDVFSTIQIPCDWTGKPSPTPVFDNFLRVFTNGDQKVIQLLLQFFGVSISNVKGYRMKRGLFVIGPGDTGKTVLRNLANRIVGKENHIGIDLGELESRFGTGTIYNKRIVGSSDMGTMDIKELKVFKRLTGGDDITVEFKGMQPFEYKFNGVLWFCANELPAFGGDIGDWLYERMMIVKSSNVIPREKQDRKLVDKLYVECEGIIYKAVKALQQVLANGYMYDEPESVAHAKTEYKIRNSSVFSFIAECMEELGTGKSHSKYTTGQIYGAYVAWGRVNRVKGLASQSEFRKGIERYCKTSYERQVTRVGGNSYFATLDLTEQTAKKFLQTLDS